MILTELYTKGTHTETLLKALQPNQARIHINGMMGSLLAVVGASVAKLMPDSCLLFVAGSKEEAYYLQNDIETLFEEVDADIEKKRVLLFPTTYRKPYQIEETDHANVLQRSEVVKQLNAGKKLVVISYPEALAEKVMSSRTLTHNTLQLNKGSKVDLDFVVEVLQSYDFERVDFVVEPGQYAVRGGIIDVFSFADERPCRVEFSLDEISSLRSFDPVTQLSVKFYNQVTVIPNLDRPHTKSLLVEERVNLLRYFGANDVVWVQGLMYVSETIEKCFSAARQAYEQLSTTVAHAKPDTLYSTANEFLKQLLDCKVVETGNSTFFTKAQVLDFQCERQPVFNKQFEMLQQTLNEYSERNYKLFIGTGSEQQRKRLNKILALDDNETDAAALPLQILECSLAKGFIDHDERLLYFTDHEIFERYHKYTVRDMQQSREALTLKELFELKPGDYVTHIDYGVGCFAGLEKIENNGRQQEVIRLTYKNNDTLYISIHGLHKISRYVGKEGAAPTLNRLGSSTWQVLKQKTKKKVKDIAKDLIALYAKRKASVGFAYSADSYLQNELEASFIYEDTPDQEKATRDVKQDMEATMPMDRLVCGDVGFGKTEIAIRAAFKAVADSKQVAVLVPTTILAYQHYKTFSERLQNMPCRVDYLNRFRSTKEKNQVVKDLKDRKIDILIGTHKLLSKEVELKDLGLLVIDEEHKFGVAIKEKLKKLKVNVDTLTLTATPIPRTLQFSLMGARDLSIINTPPLNRQPVYTEVCQFSEEKIRDSIIKELSRGGQVYFVYNRVQNIKEMAGMVQRLVPDAKVVYAHGQMKGEELEDIMMQFIEGDFDVLVCTTIIENGLDIPNANTIIINDAQNYGLSDLHQLRGRVGRSNRKAYCYLFVPDMLILTDDARKSLKAIEDFSDIGSGFSIAMRDLDIRGAGNILGAEQSGFISDIGFDMYQKILNEALEELKETDFKELYAQEKEEKQKRGESIYIAKECAIETDLEILIPDAYVTNIGERLSLYKELDGLESEAQLSAFKARLEDRFGPVPTQTMELIDTIRLRRRARELGFCKLVLKMNKMVAHFAGGENSEYFNSKIFADILQYVQSYPQHIQLKQNDKNLSIVFADIKSVSEARKTLDKIV